MKTRLAVKGLILGALGLASMSSVMAEDDQPACGMLPPTTVETNYYAGFESCALKQVREQALWKGLKSDNLVQQSRFTFTDGHLRWIWTIRIDERVSGTGRIEVTRIGRANSSRFRMEVKRHWHRGISKTKMAEFNRLASEAGIWKFENGTWDQGEEGEDVLYLHCITLGMENVKPEGFRYSHVNIGCNRPAKLKATLEHVLNLSNLDWDTVYNRSAS